jgi:GT2 family glycosyltransferase/glycosyltransferase involved in cell wall biosynthesis
MKKISKEELDRFRRSNAFDEAYYLEQYPDVAELGMDPLEHYLWIGKRLGRSGIRPTKLQSRAPKWTAIECGTGKAMPDLFDLRAAPAKAARAVLAFVQDHEQLSAITASVQGMDPDFDLIVAGGSGDLLDDFAAPCHALVRYPAGTEAPHALLHLFNSGALSDYDSLCWITGSPGPGAAIASAWKNLGSGVGLISSAFAPVPAAESVFVGQKLGTFAARIHRKKPRELPQAPTGPVTIIPALILQQLLAYRMQPSEIGAGSSAQWMLSTLLAVICDEAGLSTSTLQYRVPARPASNRSVKTIAFYLPQFHPIPENDLWWGKGFTEWTNVVKARPRFRSHYQPILPADLGFYDLRSPDVQDAQAELAKAFNVHGFCYYYYWFNGKKLLNRPIEQMLERGSPDLPFCVCWANENWSRNWDGQNKHVLLEQRYSLESNRDLIREFIKMMKDPRYIRHNGKPVVLVYRIRVIPNWLKTAAMWREECRRAGIGEIHLCAVRFGLEPLDGPPSQFGVDSYVLFPPHEAKKVSVKDQMLDLASDFDGTIFSYDAVAEADVSRFEKGYPWPVHRGAMLGWDNTARRPRDSRIFVGASPARFHRWMKDILRQEDAHNRDSESLIFVNTWNEWAEGTILEPSTRFQRGFLHAVRSAVGERAAKALPGPAAPKPSKVDAPGVAEAKWFDGAAKQKPGAPTVLVCAHVVSDKLFGGERSLLDVLDAMAQLDLNVIVAIPSDRHPNYTNLLRERSTAVVAIPYKQWRDNRDPDEAVVRAFETVIREKNVDILYANTIVLLEPLVAAKRQGRRTVVHARELIDRDVGLIKQIGLQPDEIIRTVLERSDYVVANSHETARLFAHDGATFCAPNIVDCDALDMENDVRDEIKFGIISSNIPKKGIGDFFKVAQRCEGLVPNARFIVIGPESDHLNELKQSGIPANLTIAGYAPNPAAALSKLNVVLSLSHFAESFGRTVAEAQAARRPVIGYRHGAVPELVEDGVTGYLAPYLDTDAIVKAVTRLCARPELIRIMGEAGRSKMLASCTPATLLENLRTAFDTITGSSVATSESTQPRTTIVVPVFNAFEATSACLASLAKHVDLTSSRVLMIDDGSSDPRISPLLADYGARDGFHLLTNEKNLGYTRTINRGIRWAGRDDVLLLNSDTIVTPNFLEGLRQTALADEAAGTVTAMGDNAGAFSFPEFNQPNPKPEAVSHDDHAAAILKRTRACEPVEVPTGSGFCMYIRRAVFDAIGLFDEEAFPRGYGEENDFCMRALKSGWRNLVCPNAYVFHVRTASFGAEKEKLIKHAVDTVTKRHPDYGARVKAAFNSTAMARLREAARLPVMEAAVE